MPNNSPDQIFKLREKWRRGNKLCLEPAELKTLEEIMLERTGYDFARLEREFTFRFSGTVIKRILDYNNDPCMLTEVKGGHKRQLYSLPGGKIDPLRTPFAAYKWAEFWSNSHKVYDHELSLVQVLQSGTVEQIEKMVNPLNELSNILDMPFADHRSEIRMEGYREFYEEFGLEKISRRQKNKGNAPEVYIETAKPVSIFLERYRVAGESADESAKQWFISFNYEMMIPATFRKVDEALRKGKSEEIKDIRWVSLIDLADSAATGKYHNSVLYTAKKLISDGRANPPFASQKLPDAYVPGRFQR